MGSAEFTELLELYKDRVYDANIASAARQRFGGVFGRNDRDHLSGRRRQPRELQDHALGARGGAPPLRRAPPRRPCSAALKTESPGHACTCMRGSSTDVLCNFGNGMADEFAPSDVEASTLSSQLEFIPSDVDARVMDREVEAASGSQKELTAFLDPANNSRLPNEIFLPSIKHNPVTVDLYGDALMNLPAPGDAQ
eukprot:jgi/Tetstr1/431287/TSEL_020982.t1